MTRLLTLGRFSRCLRLH